MIIERLKNLYKRKIKKMSFSDMNVESFIKRGGVIGKGTILFSTPFASEAQLVTVGDNCTISSDVFCVTHDNAIIKHIPGKTDLFGEIHIGNNCFIGMRALIMYGVSIGDNSIVGAGSVVTHSVPAGTVVAGNPARVVCKAEEYKKKYEDKAVNWGEVTDKMKYFEFNPEKLIVR